MRRSERSDHTRLAHHDLLDRVAILADDDPIAYRRVQRAEDRLARFYRDGPGWSLVRTRSVARLVKEPAPAAARGLPRLQEPLEYALFTWVLWYGEGLLLSSSPGAGGGEGQFVLSDLAEALLAQTAAVAGIEPLDLRDHRQRQSLVRALRALEVCQAIRRLQGAPEEWESTAGGANVLYEFTPLAPRLLCRVDIATLADLALGPAHPAREPAAPNAANPMQRAWRALLLGPVLHAADDPEAFAALIRARGEVAAVLQRVLGWELDLRRGYALVVRDGTVAYAPGAVIDTDRRAVQHPILLLAARYRDRVRLGDLEPDADGVVRVSLAGFESDLWALRDAYRDQWGTALGDVGPKALLRAVLEEMRAGGLLRGPDAAGCICLQPALARAQGHYGPGGQDPPGPGRPRRVRGGGEADDRAGGTALRLF